jgi:2-polyprenyl-3-methyl-5-hydroxy-6-metoxy-1,4-benzoquinol methylase
MVVYRKRRKQMATPKKDPRAVTSRTKGAVGTDPLVYRAFRKEFSPSTINCGVPVLDFGAGVGAVNTQKLRLEGYANVWACDLPDNTPKHCGLIDGWATPTDFEWGVVLLSNVLNVQDNDRDIKDILQNVYHHIAPTGVVFLNYPQQPRKSSVTVAALRDMIVVTFNPCNVTLVGGTPSAPCWMVTLRA